MRRLLLSLAYDGAAYCGFQVQPNGVTIAAVLNEAMSKVAGHPVSVRGASRTDSGVHARGQAATGDIEGRIPTAQVAPALAGLLPADISVWAAREVPLDFHCRHQAVGKHYRYTLRCHPLRDPFDYRHTYQVTHALSLPEMEEAAQMLEGRHDFRGFCAAHSGRHNFERQLDAIVLRRAEPYLTLDFWGRGFLYKMVRRISGYLIDVGRGHLPVRLAAAVLADGDGTRLGLTAPPHGLCLERVYYEEAAYQTDLRAVRGAAGPCSVPLWGPFCPSE